MSFIISKKELAAFYNATKNVRVATDCTMSECPGGRCGNNCSGTCAWSPCTNLCAATSM